MNASKPNPKNECPQSGQHPPIPPCRLLFFDLGGVIFRVDHREAWANTLKHSSLSLEEAQLRFRRSGDVISAMIGHISDQEFFSRFAHLVQYTKTPLSLHAIWKPVFKPIPGRLELLDSLVKASRRIGIISNINACHSRYLEAHYPILGSLHPRIYSWECGFMKPRPEIFAEAVRQSGIPARECGFVDDQEKNITSAKSLGWQTQQWKACIQVRSAQNQQTGLPLQIEKQPWVST